MRQSLSTWVLSLVLVAAAAVPSWAVPTVNSLTTPVLPANATRTPINSLRVSSGSTTPTRYNITSLPSGGTLYVGSTAVTAARSLTPTEATQLFFQPSGTAGNYSFGFTASDGTRNADTSPVATYVLSVGSASCGQAAGLDFSTRATNESWKSQSVTSGNVTIRTTNPDGTSSYSTSPSLPADRLAIESLQGEPQSAALTWFADYSSRTSSASQVTFTFSRPVSGFSIVVQDIDASATDVSTAGFVDQVQFDGYTSNTATTPIALTAANIKLGNANNTFSSTANPNCVTGTGTSSANPADNVIVTFSQAITKLTLTYRNVQTGNADPAQQAIGIPSFGWCAEADIATTLTGPTRAQAGSTVNYSMTTRNNGPDVPTSVTPTLQLPTGLSGLTVNNGGTYNTTNGLVTFPVINNLAVNGVVTNSLSFTMPASNAVSGTATYSSSILDNTAANNTATLSTVQNRAPVANNVTNSPAILNSTTSRTNIAPFNASDPDATTGNTTIASYTILSLPTTAQGTLYVDGTAAVLNQVITVPTSATASTPGYQLSFVPTSGYDGNATFTYKAIDDVGVSSNTANYAVPVTAGADVVSVVTGQNTGVEGQSKTYTITTTNNGPTTSTSVVPTITLSSKPAFSNVTVSNGSYDPTTGIVTFNSTTLTSGGPPVVNSVVLVVPVSPASFTVTAANTSATADPAPANNNGTAATAVLTVAVSPIGPAGTASACATPGKDGTPPTITANPNTYYPATNQTVPAGTKSLLVGTAVGTTPIASGDLLLVMQMQGADIDYSNTDAYGDGVAGGLATGILNNANFTAGQYEYVVAGADVPLGGGTVMTVTPLKNSYQNADATASTGQRRFQVVRIPQYKNLTISGTISPSPWNGSTGGILALDVTGQLTFNTGAKLDASSTGFRGGAGQFLTGTTSTTVTGTDYRTPATASATTTTGAHAMKGEGIVGTPRYVNTGTTLIDTGVDGYPGGSGGRGAPGNAGGGGTDATPTDNRQNSGGGGGGNGARGGRGGNSWSSNMAIGGEVGSPFNAPSSSRLILGGGGGAGVNNSNSGGGPTPGYASSGAAGGGIVLVRTGSVRGAGAVLANGASASNDVLNDGSGGGGAGGSILITANNTASLGSLTLSANGGNGGTNAPGSSITAHGPGGGGSGGIVLTNAASSSFSTANGVNGTTTGGVAFGATAGVVGITNSQISNSIAGSTAGINCSTDVVATISGSAAAAVGQTVNLTAVFANNGGVDANTVTRIITLASNDPLNPVTNVTAPGSTSISNPDATTGAVTITYATVSPLAAGASNSFGISYTAPGTASVVATAAITTATPGEPVTDNNTSSATTAINGYADVVTAVYGLASSITGRPTSTYAVGFANNGPAAASNVTRKVTLPPGATLTTDQLKVITDQGGTYVNGVIDFGTVASLNSRDSKVFQFSYTASTTGGSGSIFSNITTATAQDASNGVGQAPDLAEFPVTNNATSDLATNGVDVSAASVVPGQQASFTLKFINYGPADAANALRYAQLTPGLEGVSVTNDGAYNKTTGIITYPPLTLANGVAAPSTVTFTAPATGPVTISGSFSGAASLASSGIFDNNQATASIAVNPIADVATTLSGPTTAVTGNLVTFAVKTANGGPSAAAAVVQTVQLPTGLTNVFLSANGTYDASTGIVTFPTLAVLPTGGSFNNTVSFPMPGAAFTASANVATATQEATGTTANNVATAQATTPVAPTAAQANVYNTLTGPNQVLAPGAPLTFTIVTGNNGPKPALNVVQQLALSPGLTITSNTGTYDAATGIVTFPTITSQESGTSTTNAVTFVAPATGPVVAVASVASTTSDPVPADNVAILSVDIFNRTDVVTTLVGPGVAASTQVPTFIVTASNKGLVPALNVVQTVSIGAGFLPANVTAGGGGVYDPATGVITWPAVTLAPSEIKTYTYSYLAPALLSTDASNPRTIVSRATVTSSTFDNDGTNNSVAIPTEIKWNSDVSVAVAGPGSAVLGNTITFTVATTNNGPAPATNVATSVRILTGLSGVVASGGGVYDAGTGIVTFPTIASQAVGVTGAVTNTITLVVPDRPIIGVSAAVNNAANDINLTNNAANLIIPVSPRTSTLVDLQTTITSNLTSQLAGQPIILTVTALNAGNVASNLRERVALPSGLSGVVVSDMGIYDAASGTVTFPVSSNQTAGASRTYIITVNNPGNDPLVATASINGNFSDPTPTNNTQTVSVTIVPVADVATRINGPATLLPNAIATYQVVTLNNGPSPANAVVQKVQLPTGLSGVVVSGGGNYDTSSGIVTFPTIATQAVGFAGEVTNTISFLFSTTATTVIGTVTSNTAENGTTANNTSSLTTNQSNRLPLVTTTINRLQTPVGNTAAPLGLSALSGYDADGSVPSFTISTLPATATGVLLLRGSAVQPGQVIPIADAANLTFDPAASFVGNAFFTYTATDNLGAISVVPALYTIPVGQDNASVYTSTDPKGGTVSYQNGDIIADVFDANAGVYNATAAVTDNGVRTSTVNNNTLPAGLELDPATGQVRVADRTLLVAGPYTVNITTVDAKGGITTQNVPMQIGANPLPVELTRFDAKAVGLDANLSWATARESGNKGFQVERSFDGKVFEKLTFVAGAGTSLQPLAYSFVDGGVGQQHPGMVYYRLQQRDLTGKTTYSPVRTVAFVPQQLAAGVTLYPNPAAEQTTLDLTALPTGPYQVVVLDMSGRLVLSRTLAGGTAHTLTVDGLPTGSYLVLISNDKVKLSKHLIKQ